MTVAITLCRGQRLPDKALAELAAALTLYPLGNHLTASGYTLRPVRAPRGLVNGELVYRLTWWKQEENATLTVRATVRLRPAA